MNHREAVETQAPEKYVLGELSEDERQRFEEHYFGCQECADELRAAFVFADSAKAVFIEESQARVVPQAKAEAATPRFRWLRMEWLRVPAAVPVLASVFLLVVVTMQFQTIRGLRQEVGKAASPRSVQSFVLLPAARGTEAPLDLSKGASVLLEFDVHETFSRYRWEIRPESGPTVAAGTDPAPAPGALFKLLLPVSILPPGRYTLVVRGQAEDSSGPSGSETQFRFEVKSRETSEND